MSNHPIFRNIIIFNVPRNDGVCRQCNDLVSLTDGNIRQCDKYIWVTTAIMIVVHLWTVTCQFWSSNKFALSALVQQICPDLLFYLSPRVGVEFVCLWFAIFTHTEARALAAHAFFPFNSVYLPITDGKWCAWVSTVTSEHLVTSDK